MFSVEEHHEGVHGVLGRQQVRIVEAAGGRRVLTCRDLVLVQREDDVEVVHVLPERPVVPIDGCLAAFDPARVLWLWEQLAGSSPYHNFAANTADRVPAENLPRGVCQVKGQDTRAQLVDVLFAVRRRLVHAGAELVDIPLGGDLLVSYDGRGQLPQGALGQRALPM